MVVTVADNCLVRVTDPVPVGLAERIVGVIVLLPDCLVDALSDPVPVACAERIVGDTETVLDD